MLLAFVQFTEDQHFWVHFRQVVGAPYFIDVFSAFFRVLSRAQNVQPRTMVQLQRVCIHVQQMFPTGFQFEVGGHLRVCHDLGVVVVFGYDVGMGGRRRLVHAVKVGVGRVADHYQTGGEI